MSIIGRVNKSFVNISNKVTSDYEKKFGLPCDIYVPIINPNPNALGNYDNVNVFSTHGPVKYADVPDYKTKFYIPHLLKKESMLSPENEFDSFYLEGEKRPFIETSISKEVDIQSKIVVHIEDSIFQFVVEKKLVVNGASGHLILRMYLNPLTCN